MEEVEDCALAWVTFVERRVRRECCVDGHEDELHHAVAYLDKGAVEEELTKHGAVGVAHQQQELLRADGVIVTERKESTQ